MYAKVKVKNLLKSWPYKFNVAGFNDMQPYWGYNLQIGKIREAQASSSYNHYL